MPPRVRVPVAAQISETGPAECPAVLDEVEHHDIELPALETMRRADLDRR
ncbi:hypothetical protein [Streptomyces sp. NPDC002722]